MYIHLVGFLCVIRLLSLLFAPLTSKRVPIIAKLSHRVVSETYLNGDY